MFQKSVTFFLILTFTGSIQANAVASTACGERVFVEDGVVIDLSLHTNCNWLEFQTQENRILAFSLLEGTFEQLEEFLTIHDGFQLDSPTLLIKNQKINEKSKKDLPPTIYTTSFSASLRFNKIQTSPLKLKIQKAVDCPFNLGGIDTQCARIFNAESCYCVISTWRNRWDQMTECRLHQMDLVALESREEQDSIHAAWGTGSLLWTSLNDMADEDIWIWESTGNHLYPGYANWGRYNPDDNHKDGEDCVVIFNYGWNDFNCGLSHPAICEANP